MEGTCTGGSFAVNGVTKLEGASASHMTPAKVLDVISRLLGCSGQASDAVSAYKQLKIKDAPELLHLSEEYCPKIRTRPPRARRPQICDSIDDPVVPLERNRCGHPLDVLFLERIMRNFCWKEDGITFPDVLAYTFMATCKYSCQFMLTTLR